MLDVKPVYQSLDDIELALGVLTGLWAKNREIEAKYDQQIADLKARKDADTQPIQEEIRQLITNIDQFVRANMGLFRDEKDDGKKSRAFTAATITTRKKTTLVWPDDDELITAIAAHYPDLVNVLIQVQEKPIKPAIAGLIKSDPDASEHLGIETTSEVTIDIK